MADTDQLTPERIAAAFFGAYPIRDLCAYKIRAYGDQRAAEAVEVFKQRYENEPARLLRKPWKCEPEIGKPISAVSKDSLHTESTPSAADIERVALVLADVFVAAEAETDVCTDVHHHSSPATQLKLAPSEEPWESAGCWCPHDPQRDLAAATGAISPGREWSPLAYVDPAYINTSLFHKPSSSGKTMPARSPVKM